MKPGAAWRELGLTPDSEAGAVRQAYANRLRAIDPDADPAAFARLRAARDAALGDIRRRAASLASATDDPFAEAETTADPVAPWPHAAPVVDMPVPPGHVQSRGDPPAEPARPAARAAAGPADAPLVVPVALFGPPVLSAPGKGDVLADRGRGAALQQVLTKAPAIEPFDAADEASAIDHLRALLRIASAQPIEQSRAVEDWIADQLTQCWPRSAPLLAPAAEAFGWSSERGKIGERPALAFLNARLAGLRFVDAVERPGHRYYKAWVELSKPGFKRSWGVKRREVQDLLTGVRKNFPELEQHLDPQRVGAWEQVWQPAGGGRGLRFGLRKGWYWWIAVIGAFRIIGTIFGDSNQTAHQPPPTFWSTRNPAQSELDGAARYWFGANATFASVKQQAPLIATMTDNKLFFQSDNQAVLTNQAMRDAVFMGLRLALRRADHGGLRDIQSLRLDILRAMPPGAEGADCLTFGRDGRLPAAYALTPAMVDRTRSVLREAVRAIPEQATDTPLSAKVPATVMRTIMVREQLNPDRLRNALAHKGPGTEQCHVWIDLIDQALKLPGAEGDPLLRVQ